MHTGSMNMESKAHDRMMAFLYVGLAYFLTAVIAPLISSSSRVVRWISGTIGCWLEMELGRRYSGRHWSTRGALGLWSFSESAGVCADRMSIIFAGAPIVNAVVNTTKQELWSYVQPQFILGIVLAAIGGYLVTKNPPKPPPETKPVTAATGDANTSGDSKD